MEAPIEEEFLRITSKANEYHKKALWQEKLRLLQETIAISEHPDFTRGPERRQELLHDLGAIRRRLGQYDKAEIELRNALKVYPGASPLKKANILGELGVVLRHANRFEEAGKTNQQQYEFAISAGNSIEADAEVCRAVGNLGMVAYNMSQLSTSPEKKRTSLEESLRQVQERIRTARALQCRLYVEKITASFTKIQQSKLKSQAQTWETIGLGRLILVLLALGQNKEALNIAEESQERLTREDPTVTASSRFFYGCALWHNGFREKALAQWNQPRGTCSSPMAFCKEPAQEHNEYIRIMAEAGVDFDSYDEQGFSALDYAVLSDNPDIAEVIPVIVDALRKSLRSSICQDNPGLSHEDLTARLDEEIAFRMRQAHLRRQYRTLLQEHIRPEMRNPDKDTFGKLRRIYANFLAQHSEEEQMFSKYHFVKYADFKAHGRLPISSDGLTQQFTDEGEDDKFVVFFSYRWIGDRVPDDKNNTQWRRMLKIMDDFLENNHDIRPERLCLWLDYACVDQVDEVEKARGVDALPLAVTLCNAMVSLVDNSYHDRAWCGVEVMIISALVKSYGIHQWYEHDLATDTLALGKVQRTYDLDKLQLSKEADRLKIDFLMRQSKLLGKDDA